MHEASIAQNIIKTVKYELEARKISTAVEKVVFTAGKLNAIVPDSLSFHFDALKKDEEQLKDAVLEVQDAPVKAHCAACKNTIELEDPIFVCPDCGGPLTVESGQELCVTSITVKD
jgi:hydrogenase nickel incorporation protein HypA/HybF